MSCEVCTESIVTHTVQANEVKQRLDHCVVRLQPNLSRSNIGRLIAAGHVLVNGHAVKGGYKLRLNDQIILRKPAPTSNELEPEAIDFELIFEDDHLLVINKPPGLVVHPAAGHRQGTLVNGLLHRYGNLPGTDSTRPGIVHRLDKDTSGVMLVAKTEDALRNLAESFRNRAVSKTYYAILERRPLKDRGSIVAPVGRHPVNRQKMAVLERGRHAVSHYWVVRSYANGMCLVKVHIETGRTHQIRVHMASINSPIVGDELYGGKQHTFGTQTVSRQMLHARSLAFPHPVTGKGLEFTAELWPDFKDLLNLLDSQGGCHG